MVFEKIQAVANGTTPGFGEFEQIVYCNDSKLGLKAIIGMHSTVLGPATGGCRMWNYESEQEALNDVLRLSRGMTYKNSISGLNWGGGKAVIIGDPKTQKTPEFLKRYGEFVDRLGGNYITAKDVGIGSDDLRIVKSKTKHVLGIDGEPGSSGDPSPATAWGCYHGLRAAAKFAMGADKLKGVKVAVQGLGSVAYYMIEHLVAEGAEVIGCDIDPVVIERAKKKFGIETVSPEAIYDVPCDIFSPCALGATINEKTFPRIKAKIIAGAANNQLATPADGVAALRRGVTYVPDYVINAGGVINIYHEGMVQGGYNKTRAFDHVAKISQTVTDILNRAQTEKMPTYLIADKMAEERVVKAAQEKK